MSTLGAPDPMRSGTIAASEETANNGSVRRRNLGAVLTHVHRAARLSRADLTALTGLNRSTVGVLVAELAELGLVSEGDPIPRGTPGRPSPAVDPADGVAVLGVDVGVAVMRFAVSGVGGALRGRLEVERATSRRDPEGTADDVAALVRCALADLRDRPVAAIGVAVPGVVRRQDGLVRVAANLAWHDVPFAELLAARLGPDGPPVLLGNDAELGAVAEHLRGAGRGVDDLLYLVGGVGLGGGIIAGGQPFGGATGYAGEVGHLVVDPAGHDCTCGGRGCLETQVGLRALLRRLGRDDQGEREAVAGLVADAAAGDGDVLAALAECGAWLGRGIASLVNVLNPSRVLLGGYLAEVHPHVLPALRRALDHHAQRPNRSVVTVAPAALGRDAVLRGAVELALGPLLADPLWVAGR
jgi:predicted NBD/HSP70 family sugar kinase